MCVCGACVCGVCVRHTLTKGSQDGVAVWGTGLALGRQQGVVRTAVFEEATVLSVLV